MLQGSKKRIRFSTSYLGFILEVFAIGLSVPSYVEPQYLVGDRLVLMTDLTSCWYTVKIPRDAREKRGTEAAHDPLITHSPSCWSPIKDFINSVWISLKPFKEEKTKKSMFEIWLRVAPNEIWTRMGLDIENA